jgi:cytochrome c peroxidase
MFSIYIKVSLFCFSFLLFLLLVEVELPIIGLETHYVTKSEFFQHSEAIDTSKAIKPIPLEVKLDITKVNLGFKLFHEPRLSKNNSLSCASCHNLKTAGTLNIAKAVGVNGVMSKRNIPTVFNSSYNALHHWDGKFDSLELQVSAPILNPNEMGSNWPNVIDKLNKDPYYVTSFENIYGAEISEKLIKNAIVIFESSLITPNSRFDQFLRGDKKALDQKEKDGYKLFQSLGCISCHQGINIGGNSFQKIGLFKKYTPIVDSNVPDLGRYEITGNEIDKYVFKVPSLRNVSKTAPYFHDGSVKTLEQAISLMAEYQLGRKLSSEDIEMIKAFLNALTGNFKGKPL